MSSPNDSTQKTLIVATALCIVCSILVSIAAVALRESQSYNKALDKKKNILAAAGLFKEGMDVDAAFQNIEAKLVDLNTGEYSKAFDANTYDQKKAAKDPAQSISIEKRQDLAGIKQRAKLATVYLVKEGNGSFSQVILPVHGKGLWSTMYGFMALDKDMQTIRGFSFYQHGETPGLGGEVDNPRWKAMWPGKKVYAEDGSVKVEVIKGSVNPKSPNADYQVDGLSGATITARGVKDLLRYWLGENGFGTYITKLRSMGGRIGEG